MELSEAQARFEAEYCGPNSNIAPEDEFIVVEEATIERSWGWVFFYTSKLWKETGDIRYAIAGNAPVIFEKETQRFIETGTADSIEHYLEAYESTGDPYG